jgi:hypothetical protein
MHTFGIDTAVNDAFLKQMAAQQHGTCHLLTPRDDLVGTVLRLGPQVRAPVWRRITPEAPWKLAQDRSVDLHAGEIVSVVLKGPGSAGLVTLRGERADGQAHAIECALAEQALPPLRLLWRRVGHGL